MNSATASSVLFGMAFSLALTSYAAAQSDSCAKGYVWREAFEGDHVCVSPDTGARAKSDNASALERRATKDSDECVQGFVWRLAKPDDHVCVPHITRGEAAQDNELAYTRSPGRTPQLIFQPVSQAILPN